MTDTQVQETSMADPEGTNAEAATDEQPKAPKIKAEPRPCTCSTFEVGDGTDEGTYTTGCESTTARTFAQGHDARLVSFLVDAQYDGYPIQQAVDGTAVQYRDAAEAAGSISPALRAKAEKAVANRQAKREEKDRKTAEREAAKAAKAQEKAEAKAAKAAEKEKAKAAKDAEVPGPKDVPVQVAEHAGPGRIKVGRREFDAMIGEDGSATYQDANGVAQKIERDGYRLLSNA